MRLLLFICAATLVFSGCSIVGPDDPVPEPRIVFGESIDRVRIGDAREAVLQTLGEPNGVLIGDFPGVIFEYTEGDFAGMHVTIWEDNRVRGVLIQEPYSGKTAEGVGIGSARETVLRLLKYPHSSGEGAADGSLVDIYCYGGIRFGIIYSNGSIDSISMGDSGPGRACS